MDRVVVVHMHRAELVEPEQSTVGPHALLTEEHRPTTAQLHRHRDKGHSARDEGKEQQEQQQVECSLETAPAPRERTGSNCFALAACVASVGSANSMRPCFRDSARCRRSPRRAVARRAPRRHAEMARRLLAWARSSRAHFATVGLRHRLRPIRERRVTNDRATLRPGGRTPIATAGTATRARAPRQLRVRRPRRHR